MNIKKLNEELTSVLNEDLSEDELHDMYEIYVRAYQSLEELQDVLDRGVDPLTGKLDPETNKFYDAITELINEIYSRSLAFEM